MIGTNPLDIARGLAREAVFAWCGARQFAKSGPLAWSGTGIGVTVGPAGPGLSFAGGASTGRVLGASTPDSPSATFIFVTSSISAASGGGGLGRICSTYNGTGGHDIPVQSNGSTETLRSQEFYSGGGGAFEFVGTGNLLQSAKPRVGAVAVYGIAGVAPIAAVDGVLYSATAVGAAGSGTRQAGGFQVGVGCRPDSTARQLSGNVFGVVKIPRALSPEELAAVTQSLETFYALFDAEELDLLFAKPASASGSTGTVAATLDPFTSSATGTTTVTGTSAQTLASFTPAATGTTTVTGTSAQTLAAFTSNASGSVGSSITGTVAATLDPFTSSASGTTTVTGTSAQTLASFTPSATGTTTVTGSSAQTLAAFTATASGFAGGITGTVAATLDAFTSSASGSGGPIVDTQTGGYTSPQRLKKPRTWNFASTGVLGLQGQGTCTHIPPRVQRHQAQGRAVPLGGAARVTRANPITARLRRQAKVAMLLKL